MAQVLDLHVFFNASLCKFVLFFFISLPASKPPDLSLQPSKGILSLYIGDHAADSRAFTILKVKMSRTHPTPGIRVNP